MKCYECKNLRINHSQKVATCSHDGSLVVIYSAQQCRNRKYKTAPASLAEYQKNWLDKQM